jgi:antitoxin ParD1/3/4
MTKLDVALPDDLKKFVDAEASAGGYESPAAYVQDVLRALWTHRARESLETQMIEAINSEPAIEVTPEFWKNLKARVHKKLAEAAR